MSNQLKVPMIMNESNSKEKSGFYSVFITTFSAVFLAELGDKTQIATLLLTAQSGKPVIVFVGASSALVCSSLVGVLLGRWLANIMPTERFNYLAGLLMIGVGILLGLQATTSLIQNM